jgi:hypothetical protein
MGQLMGEKPMARLTERLSFRFVAAAKPGMHPDGNGLYLKVGPTGSKSWIYRYRANSARHDMGSVQLTSYRWPKLASVPYSNAGS